jgi:hypothetical protein
MQTEWSRTSSRGGGCRLVQGTKWQARFVERRWRSSEEEEISIFCSRVCLVFVVHFSASFVWRESCSSFHDKGGP